MSQNQIKRFKVNKMGFFNKKPKINPIEIMLCKLGTNEILVTNHYLEELVKLFAPCGVQFGTYGNVFKLLQFLHDEGCVTLKQNSIGSYTLTGLYNYGK